mgnify:FL=1
MLSPAEMRILALLGEVANLYRNEVLGHGPTRDSDWDEFALRLHAVQHMVMKQAAARAYPTKFRLAGEVVRPDASAGQQ